MNLGRVHHLHFVGAGGVGMCGLAEVLLAEGLVVSGCDAAASERTDRLRALGAQIAVGHDPAHLEGVDAVVVSAAVSRNHPELSAALEAGIPVVRRSQMLDEVMRGRHGVAVAGTHGKTTTTALVGHLLAEVEMDPTVIVGGRLMELGAHARIGRGRVLVCEADEFDRSFLNLHPVHAVITNIEAEHLECYGSFTELMQAFSRFAGRVPFYGAVVYCADDPGARSLAENLDGRRIGYGTTAAAELRAVDLEESSSGCYFTVQRDGLELGSVSLMMMGVHNVCNALAAMAVGLDLDVDFERLAAGCASFSGVARRFQVLGERGGVTVVDDYAHHPTEVAAVLAAARQAYPQRRLVAVFQPHLFSRTEAFAADFGRALCAAEVAVVLPVYAAREEEIAGISNQLVVDEAQRCGHEQAICGPDPELAVELLAEIVNHGDVLLTMGAGDVHRVGERWLRARP